MREIGRGAVCRELCCRGAPGALRRARTYVLFQFVESSVTAVYSRATWTVSTAQLRSAFCVTASTEIKATNGSVLSLLSRGYDRLVRLGAFLSLY